MFAILGWVGAVCFSLCAVPQAVKCIKQGHAHGLDHVFLLLWFIGEISMLVYSMTEVFSLPLIANYTFNLICLVVILRYRFWPTISNGDKR